jgi:hypothetical protein
MHYRAIQFPVQASAGTGAKRAIMLSGISMPVIVVM